MTPRTILRLPGDGIGPEVTEAASQVIAATSDRFGIPVRFVDGKIGGSALDTEGVPLPDRERECALQADAVLLGAVGGPRWDQAPVRPERGLLDLRKLMGLYANLRPVRIFPGLADLSPLKRPQVDMLVVRELSGGLYYGEPRGRETTGPDPKAYDTLTYSRSEIVRLVEVGFRHAELTGRPLTSVDKANVMESSRFWRETVDSVAREYPRVTVHHQLVDSAALLMVAHPEQFSIIVTENMFGDILSDLAGGLVGSLGLCPSASLGNGSRGLYEPVHGSAPDLAGRDLANPLGAILSAALLFRWSLGAEEAAAAIERAVDAVIAAGFRTADIRTGVESETPVGTRRMTDEVVRRLSAETQ